MNNPEMKTPRDAMRNGNYTLAFEMYQTRIQENPTTISSSDLIEGAYCASRCEKYMEGNLWIDKVLALDPNHAKARETKAWLIFREIFLQKQNRPLEKQIDGLYRLIDFNAGESAQNLPAKAALTICTQLLTLKSPPYLTMVKWIRAINTVGLNNIPGTKKLPDGSQQSYPSDLERYLTLVCNIYFKGEYFEDCILACNELLRQYPEPHYGNEIWIKRKLAYCLAATGQYQDAAKIYNTLSEKQPVWFIRFEYARVLIQSDEHALARKMLAKAMLTPGPVAVKVHLVGFYARFLHDNGPQEMAEKHTQLHKAIYNEKNWIKPTEYEIVTNDSQSEEESDPLTKDLIKSLKPWWKIQAEETPAMLSGKIIKMNPGNLSGFIQSEDGRSLYFSLADWMPNKQAPQVRLAVKFAITRRLNKKTQLENDVAILVTPIN
jgi:tetratricopeptide (TPR) repeat protein